MVKYHDLHSVAQRNVLKLAVFSGALTLLLSASVGAFALEPQAVTAATAVRSWDASGSFARTSNRSVVRSTFRRCFPYSPPPVGFGLLRWSIAGCNLHVVQLSCLFEPHAIDDNFCYHTFPVWGWTCSFPSAQQAWRSWSQGNLRGRSMKGQRSASTDWHTNPHAIQGSFFNFIC